jgi:hypothetical protein
VALSRINRVCIGENLGSLIKQFGAVILIGGNQYCAWFAFCLGGGESGLVGLIERR